MNQENLDAVSISEALCLSDIYYAVTIKPVLQDRTYYYNDINDVISQRLKRFKRHKQVWELDHKGILHAHLLCSGDVGIKYKLIHLYGWHIHIQPLATTAEKRKWENYLTKDKDIDVCLRHISMHQNLFDY